MSVGQPASVCHNLVESSPPPPTMCNRSSSGGSWRSSARQSGSTSACSRSRFTCCRCSTSPNRSRATTPKSPRTRANLLRPPPCPPTESSPPPRKLRSLTVIFLWLLRAPEPFRLPPLTAPNPRLKTLTRHVSVSCHTPPAPQGLNSTPTLNLPSLNTWSPIGLLSRSVILLSLSER